MKFRILLLAALIAPGFSACKKKKLNEELYEHSKAADLVYYQSLDTILQPKGGSPHGEFKLRFNALAASQLGPDGKLPVGNLFPVGSLIVKEVYSAAGELTLYAVMRKDDTRFAGNGWLWGEYKPNGEVVYSIGEKGKNCTSCHSASGHRDMVRSFELH